MFFCAKSIPSNADEFDAALRALAATVRPGE
jgi:hypothetical protein